MINTTYSKILPVTTQNTDNQYDSFKVLLVTTQNTADLVYNNICIACLIYLVTITVKNKWFGLEHKIFQ